MITVFGSVIAAEGCLEELLDVSLEHVLRSRQEDGCVAHGVYIDAETPTRLVFFEKWSDEAALRQHFAVPESRAFVQRAAALAVGQPVIEIFRSESIRF